MNKIGTLPFVISIVIVAIVVSVGTWLVVPSEVVENVVTDKIGEGVTIAFVDHVSAADASRIATVQAMNDAAALLGCDVSYSCSEGDLTVQVDIIRAKIAAGVDVIVSTMTDETLFDAPCQEAVDAGIIFINFTDEDPSPNAAHSKIINGTGYDCGQLLARTAYTGGYIPDPAEVLFVTPDVNEVWGIEVRKGIEGYLSGVDYTLTVIESSFDVDVGESRLTAYLIANMDDLPDVFLSSGCCCVDSWVLAMKGLDWINPGDIPTFGFTLTPIAQDGLRELYVTEGAVSSAYLMGYYPVVQGVLAVKKDIIPIDVIIPLTMVDADTIDEWLEKNVG